MKNGRLGSFAHRALAMLLALLTVMPAGILTADGTMKTSQTKIIVWDWIDDMQKIASGADYNPDNESKNIPVGQVKYSRIMFYQNTGGDRYFFNATDRGGSDSSWYSTYDEDKIYVNSNARVGNSSHKEWNSDMIAAEGGGSFLTKSGMNTPYVQYGGTKEGYQCWRLWAASANDAWSNHAIMQVDDYEDLDVRRTDGFAENAVSHYGAKNDSIRADCWIIDKKFTGAAAANYKFSFDNFVIWHWDNDSGGYNEAMDFDVGDRKFKTYNAGRNDGVEEFKIFLGKEYKVSTLAEDFEVYTDQTQTLGKPVYYIPKDKCITVDKHATLVIDGVLLNDGEIKVNPGGLLMLKDGAKIFPLTKYDNDCGKIYSEGSIIIGTGAVLCGGANNGVRIMGGGVVNFGTLCGEYIELGKNDLVDNRVEETSQGYIIAGKSLTGAARSRYVKAAILNEDTAKMDVDRSKDFATLNSNSGGSKYITQKYSVYGDGAANVNTSGVGQSTIGSATNPTLSVYYADVPGKGKNGTVLFKDEMLDEVSLRISGTKAIYTVRGTEHTIENALVSAEIGRGKDTQTLFKDMWVGKLDGAYVQLEPASALGTCLAVKDNGTANGTNVQLGKRDVNQTVKGQWWRLTEAGKDGVNQTYRLESWCASGKSLDLPGNNSAPDGANVQIWTTEGDTGSDRRWLLSPDAYNRNYYFLRNAANTGSSMEADGTAAGANVKVATNAAYTSATVDRQRWTFVNLFDEESYGSSLTEAAAMEIIPQNATGLRLDLSGAGTGAAARVSTADSDRKLQRWELRQAGADNVEGKSTPYYRVVNKESGKALTVNGAYKDKTGVIANNIESGSSAKTQYWYLESSGGANQYYLRARGDSNYALAAAGTSSGAAAQLSAWVKGEKSQMWELTGGSAVVNQSEELQKQAENDPYYNKIFVLEPSTLSGKYIVGDGGWEQEGVPEIGNRKIVNEKYVTVDKNDPAVRWSFRKLGADGDRPYYQIVSTETADCVLGAWKGSVKDWGYVSQQVSNNDSKAQHWYIDKNTDGTYTFTHRSDDKLVLGYRYLRGGYETALCSGTKNENGVTYSKVTWNLIEIVQSPLDGKTFNIESAALTGKFIIPYNYDGNSGQSAHCAVSQGADKKSYGRWSIKQVGIENGEPYFYIYSTHDDQLLFATLRANDYYVYSAGDINIMDDHYNDPKEFYYKPKFCWFIRTNSDGTYTFVSRSDAKVAMGVDAKDYNRLKTTTLGSTPTDSQKWKLTAADPNADFLDGKVFYLSPKHTGSDMMLDVESYSVSDGTKLVLWEKREHESQRWKFECVGTASQDGETVRYYNIHSVYSPTRALDNGGSTANNTRCTIYNYTASNLNQQWIVKDAGDGYYYISPRADATKALACAGAGKSNGTAVTIYDNNGQDDIKWKLTETMVPAELGTYELEVVGAAGWTMDVYGDLNDAGADIQIFPAHERDYTRWTFIQMGTDGSGEPYYKIVNKGSGKVLDVYGYVSNKNVKEGAPITQANYDYGADQLWYLDKAGSDELGDYYYIRSKASWSYKVCVLNAKYEKNQHINLTSGQEDNAKWRMNDKSEPVSLGVYEFGSTNPEWLQMRMDVFGGDTSNGNNIQLWHRTNTVTVTTSALPGSGLFGMKIDSTGGLSGLFTEQVTVLSAQTFEIIQRGKAMYNGEITPYYSIENTKSKKALDPPDTASVYDGMNIQQYTYDGYADQHWFLEIRGDNSVVFRNRANTDLVLASSTLSDGGNILLKTYDEKAAGNMRWYLHPIMLQSGEQYFVPGNAAAAEVGIPFVQDQDVVYDPAVGGNYTLTPQHKSGIEGQRMDLANGSGPSVTAVINNGSNAQRWKFIPSGVDFHDGGSGGRMFYRIAAKNDNSKVLDVQWYNMPVAGNTIQCATWDGGYDQLYYLEEVGGKDDTFYLIARGTLSQAKKICIEVSAGSPANAAAIKTATKFEKTYQQWQLELVD